jgi:hypothetical protein
MIEPRQAMLYDVVDDDGPSFNEDHPRLEDEAEKERILTFLHGGTVVARTSAKQGDVVDASKGQTVPTLIYTDGKWVWTAAHSYYLDNYGLLPEPEFVKYIKESDYCPNKASGEDVAAAVDVLYR